MDAVSCGTCSPKQGNASCLSDAANESNVSQPLWWREADHERKPHRASNSPGALEPSHSCRSFLPLTLLIYNSAHSATNISLWLADSVSAAVFDLLPECGTTMWVSGDKHCRYRPQKMNWCHFTALPGRDVTQLMAKAFTSTVFRPQGEEYV